MIYTITLSDQAKKDIQFHYKAGNKNTIKRIERIFVELSENPRSGFASPEQLTGNLSGLWSRQINKKDRIIYSIEENSVRIFVISAKGHYKNK